MGLGEDSGWLLAQAGMRSDFIVVMPIHGGLNLCVGGVSEDLDVEEVTSQVRVKRFHKGVLPR